MLRTVLLSIVLFAFQASACLGAPGFDLNVTRLYGKSCIRLDAKFLGENIPPGVSAQLRNSSGTVTLRKSKLTFSPGKQSLPVNWSIKGLLPGKYMVLLLDSTSGETLKIIYIDISAAPKWVGTRVGSFDDNWVPKPWTPLELISTKQLQVKCWGRKYTFGPSGIDSIQASGAELLASPMLWSATISGQSINWKPELVNVLKKAGGAIEFASTQSAEGARLKCSGRIEFDGFVKLDFQIESVKTPVTIDNLTVEIPFISKHATLMHYYPKVPVWYGGVSMKGINCGSVPAGGWKSVFIPHVWIGDEDRGLQWLCESDENWNPADPDKSLELLPEVNTTTLRLNLIGKPVLLNKPRNYTFGFEASPVKPMPADKHEWHYAGVGRSSELTANPNGDLQSMTARTVSIFNWTRLWGNPRPTVQEDIKALQLGVKTAHQKGMKLLPFQAFLLSDASTEFPEFNKECRINDEHAYSCPGYIGDTVYAVCQNSIWADYLVDGIADSINKYDLDGLYADSITCIGPCTNQMHGCGYIGEDGQVHPTIEIFATRNVVKRIYRVLEEREQKTGKKMMFIGHTSANIMLPALGFCSAYLDAEHLTPLPRPMRIPLDVFRAEFMGHNFGIPAMDLSYGWLGTGTTADEMIAISLLHDAEVPWNYDFMAPIWKAWDKFGMTNTQFLPYWKDWGWKAPDGVKVSAYSKPDGKKMLIVAANLSELAVEGSISLDQPIISATDAFTGKAVTVENGKIVDKFPIWLARMYEVYISNSGK